MNSACYPIPFDCLCFAITLCRLLFFSSFLHFEATRCVLRTIHTYSSHVSINVEIRPFNFKEFRGFEHKRKFFFSFLFCWCLFVGLLTCTLAHLRVTLFPSLPMLPSDKIALISVRPGQHNVQLEFIKSLNLQIFMVSGILCTNFDVSIRIKLISLTDKTKKLYRFFCFSLHMKFTTFLMDDELL